MSANQCEKIGHYCPNCDRSFPDPQARIAELEAQLRDLSQALRDILNDGHLGTIHAVAGKAISRIRKEFL